ncbi:MAG: hypothetical protein QGH15_13585 [Kiritimatiellia bacterium]|jgi:hypothetical protein|nr:hypothetical protein [Kiritimatiellia bacterium]
MTDSINQRFVDHPAPSIGLVSLFLGLICLLLVAFIPAAIELPKEEVGDAAVVGFFAIMVFSIGILCFYLWPLYTTFYIIDSKGITVKYGPWTHVSRWEDFTTLYWQQGMFITKIGWPSINPCVRLSNGLVLPRKTKRWGLYLTPNDPKAFIERIELFAPGLTKEMIK